jgi:DNA-binding NtrC family response regulator
MSSQASLSRSSSLPAAALPRSLRTRTVLIVSPDLGQRRHLATTLGELRWRVLEADCGAAAWTHAAETPIEAVLVDSWLPDLDLNEFLEEFRRQHPRVDLLLTDGMQAKGAPRCSYHQELLFALRRSAPSDTAAWNAAPVLDLPSADASISTVSREAPSLVSAEAARRTSSEVEPLPGLIGRAPAMLEVSRRVRLVAPHRTPVLIEGPTGTGKERVAESLHRLSDRATRPFVAINCAAIPEALLEAELFGHTRGAFTGAVQGRTGRIESADGGTLFLDEIGEMPLALQAKLLRFLECGELQRVGENTTVRVDVRIVAATHQHLAADARAGRFRADLYHRLAVFLIRTPALTAHAQDLPLLVEHSLCRLGERMPVKRIDAEAMERLVAHRWPGNVRELEHVLERAAILAADSPWIRAREIEFGDEEDARDEMAGL